MLLALLVIGLGSTFGAEINIGIRYILPAFGPAMILLGGLWQTIKGWWGVALAAAAILLAAENLSVAPRYLTFVNAAAGGASKGYLRLNDSNFDWGQGLLDLRAWITRNHVGRIGMCYFGSADPAIYGIDSCLITQVSNESYVAISSYFLVGLWHRLPSSDIELEHVRLPFYRQLREKKPVAVLGSTIFIYNMSDMRDAVREAASQLGMHKPVPPS
jgi:hypothetical protein